MVIHGAKGGDELNLIEKGKNYGWPLVAYGEEYSGSPIRGAVTDRPGFEQPRYHWDPVIAPSGAQFYTADAFPAWRGSLFTGGLKDQRLVRLTLENDRVSGEEHLLADRSQRVRDVRQGPDGASTSSRTNRMASCGESHRGAEVETHVFFHAYSSFITPPIVGEALGERRSFATVFLLSAAALSFSAVAYAQPAIRWANSIEIAAGGGQRGPWQQNESKYDYVDDPSVTFAPDGAVAVAWVEQRRKDVFFQLYEPNGKPRLKQAVNVSRTPAVFSWLPRLAISPARERSVRSVAGDRVFGRLARRRHILCALDRLGENLQHAGELVQLDRRGRQGSHQQRHLAQRQS